MFSLCVLGDDNVLVRNRLSAGCCVFFQLHTIKELFWEWKYGKLRRENNVTQTKELIHGIKTLFGSMRLGMQGV